MQSVNYESQSQLMSTGLSNTAIERILNKKLSSGNKIGVKHVMNGSKKTTSILNRNSDSDNVTSEEAIIKKRSKLKKRKEEVSPVPSSYDFVDETVNNHLLKQEKASSVDEYVSKKIKNNILRINDVSSLNDKKSTNDIHHKSVKVRKRKSSTESSDDESFNIQSEIAPSVKPESKAEFFNSESSLVDEHIIKTKYSSKPLQHNASTKDKSKKKNKAKEYMDNEIDRKPLRSELEADYSTPHRTSNVSFEKNSPSTRTKDKSKKKKKTKKYMDIKSDRNSLESELEAEDSTVNRTSSNNILHSDHDASSLDNDKSTNNIQLKSVKKRKRKSSTENSDDEPFNIQSEAAPSIKSEVRAEYFNSESSLVDQHIIKTKHSSKTLKQNASAKDKSKKKKETKEYMNNEIIRKPPKSELEAEDSAANRTSNVTFERISPSTPTKDKSKKKKITKEYMDNESDRKSLESELEAEDSTVNRTSNVTFEKTSHSNETPPTGKSSSSKEKHNISSRRKKHKSTEASDSEECVRRNIMTDIVMETVENNPQDVFHNIELPSPKNKTLNKRIQEIYPDVKPIKLTTNLEISDSEDVYLFRMPKNVDPRLLQNTTIELDSKCKMNIGEKYVIRPSNKVPDPSLIISNNGRIVQFKGCINMEKHIKAKKELSIEAPEKLPMPLPDNLKQRHPIFGSDFKNKIRLSEYAEKKIDEAISNLLKEDKRSKKKKHKRKHEEGDKEEVIFDLLNTHSSTNSTKDKIKKEISEDSEISSFNSGGHERKKKKKKEKDKNSNIAEIMQMVKSEIFS